VIPFQAKVIGPRRMFGSIPMVMTAGTTLRYLSMVVLKPDIVWPAGMVCLCVLSMVLPFMVWPWASGV
jgi:hypothetical protein